MPDLRTIRTQVQDRLKELEGLIAPLRAELDELQGVAEKFTSNGAGPARRTRRAAAAKTAAPPATAAAKPARAPRRSRRASGGGGGSRAQQAITLIAGQPGMTVPEMAKAMGIGSNYLYRVLPQLEKEGKVNKQGKGYHPVEAPPAEAPAAE
jgi:hypothetical protein